MEFVVLFLLGLLVGCEREIACTLEAVNAVNIVLEDQEGNPITDAEISYTVEGEEGTDVMSFSDGSYALGVEQAGDYEISIYTEVYEEGNSCCWQEGRVDISVTVESDECHVIPALLEPELEWVDICIELSEEEDCG
jgi:hypothetical protein